MCPALDAEMDTEEKTADISAAATVATNAINVGRAGFAKAEGFTVEVSEASAANMDTDVVRKLRFYAEVTYDNGTTYHRIGVATGRIGAAGIPKQLVWGPLEYDGVPENFVGANIDFRVVADWTNVLASTDDFNFRGWLGNQNIGIRTNLVN